MQMIIKTDRMKTRANIVVQFNSFLANCPPHFSSRLISNKLPFLKVEIVGAYLKVSAYSRGHFI